MHAAVFVSDEEAHQNDGSDVEPDRTTEPDRRMPAGMARSYSTEEELDEDSK